MQKCTICLSKCGLKDLADVKVKSIPEISVDIIQFCLCAKISDLPGINKQVCRKCMKKLIEFYEFKVLAHQSKNFVNALCYSETNKHVKPEHFNYADEKCEVPIDHNFVKEEIFNTQDYEDENSTHESENYKQSTQPKIKFEKFGIQNTNLQSSYEKSKDDKTTILVKHINQDNIDSKKSFNNLKTHKCNEKTNKFPCLYGCDRSYKTISARRKHERNAHENVNKNKKERTKKVVDKTKRSYLCDYCSKSFNRSHHLERHIRTHTGARPYPCPTCGKAYRTTGSLRKHQNLHAGIIKYICDHCSKGFIQRGGFMTHIKIHSKEKPYPCSFCSLRFGRTDNRKVHEANTRFKADNQT